MSPQSRLHQLKAELREGTEPSESHPEGSVPSPHEGMKAWGLSLPRRWGCRGRLSPLVAAPGCGTAQGSAVAVAKPYARSPADRGADGQGRGCAVDNPPRHQPVQSPAASRARQAAALVPRVTPDPLHRQQVVASQLAALRTRRGMSQQQLAARVGTKQPAISRLESGTYNPSLALLERVTAALGATLEIQLRPLEDTGGRGLPHSPLTTERDDGLPQDTGIRRTPG